MASNPQRYTVRWVVFLAVCSAALNWRAQLQEANASEHARSMPPACRDALSGTLERLDLSYNRLCGPLPPGIGNAAAATTLESLALWSNELSGAVPASFGALRRLHTLSLHANRLGGELPRALSALTALRVLSLHGQRGGGGAHT